MCSTSFLAYFITPGDKHHLKVEDNFKRLYLQSERISEELRGQALLVPSTVWLHIALKDAWLSDYKYTSGKIYYMRGW